MNIPEATSLALAVIIAEARAAEQADTLAYLRKRHRAAETMAQRSPEEADYAGRLRDQIAIEIEMIAQGLHVGDAIAESELDQAGAASAD